MQIQSVDRNSFDGGKAQNGGGGGRGGWVGAAVGAMMMMKKKTKTKTPSAVNTRAVSGEGSGGDVIGRLQFYASSSGGGKGGRRKSKRPSRLNPATVGASQTIVQSELGKGDATGRVPGNDSVPTTIGYGGGADSDVGQEKTVASPLQRVVSMEL